MEDALWDYQFLPSDIVESVLILVVMEDALWGEVELFGGKKEALS